MGRRRFDVRVRNGAGRNAWRVATRRLTAVAARVDEAQSALLARSRTFSLDEHMTLTMALEARQVLYEERSLYRREVVLNRTPCWRSRVARNTFPSIPARRRRVTPRAAASGLASHALSAGRPLAELLQVAARHSHLRGARWQRPDDRRRRARQHLERLGRCRSYRLVGRESARACRPEAGVVRHLRRRSPTGETPVANATSAPHPLCASALSTHARELRLSLSALHRSTPTRMSSPR